MRFIQTLHHVKNLYTAEFLQSVARVITKCGGFPVLQ